MTAMSKYTTELRFICEAYAGYDESVGGSGVASTIAKALPKLFDFDFPLFDEKYRTALETKIIRHYYTREICEETVGLWKLRLQTRLNEIMPYYNQLYSSELLDFNPFYTDNLSRSHSNKVTSNKNTSSNSTTTNSSSGTVDTTNNNVTTGSGSGSRVDTGIDLYSDTPQGSITNLENEKYLTNARKTSDTSTNESNTNNTSDTTSKVTNSESGNSSSNGSGKEDFGSAEEYLESVVGFSGVNGSEMLMKYRETFLNIDLMIINDLEDLFFGLW